MAEVTTEARGPSEARKEPQAKEWRQFLEAEEGQKTDSPLKPPEGTEPR